MTAVPTPWASAELSVPLDTLARLERLGPRAAGEIQRLVGRGDWKTRALAVSALGQLVRADPHSRRLHPFRHLVARRLPWVRHRLSGVGPHGAYVRGTIANAAVDRSWIVRTAAALALGECGGEDVRAILERLLGEPYRPVRLAAAAALLACGAAPSSTLPSLAGAEPAPERLGDTADTLEWLARIASGHREILSAWAAVHEPSLVAAPATAWAQHLAGELKAEPADSRQAEILRYAQDKETHYNFTKPFTRVNRTQNVRLLHSFLVVAENLRVPTGGRILDLGGGAGWVSELLAKLGYRPFTLDLSPSLIRVGRDRFQRENLAPRFTCGDMTALPMVSSSLDAVVVIDALHHVPGVPAVFREAFRVLAPGGQFILAEPGEGHAETEKSRAEISDHGVCEREIHLGEAVRYGREAGFDDVQVVPHYVPSVSMTPEDLARAAVTPSETWRVHDAGRPVAFNDFLIQSVINHPILVFRKGQRPLDSRMPRELLGKIQPALSRDGALLTGVVAVENAGDTLWLRGGDEAGCVRLGFQLMTGERKLLSMDFARAELPADIPPGRRAEVAIRFELPSATEGYTLKVDLVDEHVCWFEDVGSKPVYVAI